MVPDPHVEKERMAATDGTLVLGVLRGDRSAFAELYDRRARLIRAICFDATRDMQIASELTQDVFVRAFQKLGDLSDPQRFAPWLVGIARHACQEWRRGRVNERRRRRELSDDAPDRPPGDDLDEQVAALREAMKGLPDRERLALHDEGFATRDDSGHRQQGDADEKGDA
jgi:RNA polymerase sigma-70 factor (ECF subfamily)